MVDRITCSWYNLLKLTCLKVSVIYLRYLNGEICSVLVPLGAEKDLAEQEEHLKLEQASWCEERKALMARIAALHAGVALAILNLVSDRLI